MITLEAFKRRLDELIEAKEPFIAYRYPRDFGVLRTGLVRATREAGKPVSKALIKRWRRQLKRIPPFELLVVEFDGEHITTNGGVNPWQN